MLRENLKLLEGTPGYKVLMDAFNEERTHIIQLEDSHFIAVHYQKQHGDTVIEQLGYFTYGKST